MVTPGTLTDAAYLDALAPALLAAVLPPTKGSTTWGGAWVELSTGDFSATPSSRATPPPRCCARNSACSRRASCCSPDDADRRGAPQPTGHPCRRSRAANGWQFSVDAAQRALTEQLQTTGLAGLRPRRPSVRGRRRRGTRPVPARHAEGRPHARPQPRLSRDARWPDHRRHHAAPPRGARLDARATGRRPLLGVLDETVTTMGARLLRAWLTQAAGRARRHPRPARCRRRPRVQDDGARQPARHARSRSTTSSASSPARRSARPARAISSRCRASLAAVPGLRETLEHAAGAVARAAVGGARRPARRCARRSPRTLADDPPLLARDGDVVRDGADPEVDRLRSLSRSGKGDISAMEEAERQRTGIGVAEDPLQPRLRLLHRDLEVEPARGAGRLHPQADDRRWRAVHHAGAEDVRGTGPRRRRAPRRRSKLALFEALRRDVADPRACAAAHRAGARHARRAGDVRRRCRTRATTASRTCTTATISRSSRAATRSSRR